MDCQKIALEETSRFSKFFLDYLNEKEELKAFYGHFPSKANFNNQIELKAGFSKETRKIVAAELLKQYDDIGASEAVLKNIHLLKEESTFTITTGHQLNIFTGPLYFIYKIVTVINACEQLKAQYPQYNFVPVYWMASEDHDFEEISSFKFSGKKYVWRTDQKGATGKFDPSTLEQLIKEVPGIPSFFTEAYKSANLADAVRFYVNYLFGDRGLVVIDADNHQMKKLFSNVIADDILSHTAKSLVEDTSNNLQNLKYKAQVYPREINFFYLKDDIRERIIEEEGAYKVLNTEISFTKDEIQEEIHNYPERFSPNVVLRPLYEEMILPNLAYVGGPAEVVYWLQLKSTFDHYKVPFPMLMPRNFGMVIPENIQRKISQTGFSLKDFFNSLEALSQRIVDKHATHNVHLNGQLNKMNELFGMIKEQAEAIDKTLAPHIEAQKAKTAKRLELIEKKFIRAEKRNQEDRIRQVEAVLDYLFPEGVLQERVDNFLNFYLEKPSFIDDVSKCFDPFDYRLHILNYGG